MEVEVNGRMTYKVNVSLYFGDHKLGFDLVANLCFFSASNGPSTANSTNGRKVPVVAHLSAFAAITE